VFHFVILLFMNRLRVNLCLHARPRFKQKRDYNDKLWGANRIAAQRSARANCYNLLSTSSVFATIVGTFKYA
jgi:hypothetical protein